MAGAGTFLLPFLLLIALWKLLGRGPAAVYLVVNIIAVVTLIPDMSGLIQRLLQRAAAVTAFGPAAISAAWPGCTLKAPASSGGMLLNS